ncbi:carbohydrate porin [Xanthobacter sp. TB0139]|uniref:carbohydrate porin n=1 Tax=Xanthobacter sp. TB0139 TaxID=3459178 RepID=UPI0040390458
MNSFFFRSSISETAHHSRPVALRLLGSASLCTLGLALAMGVASPAHAADLTQANQPAGFTPSLALPPSLTSLLEQETLTGDWGGLRTKLEEDHGITIGLTQTMDILGNVSGGIRQGSTYDGVFKPEVTIDLEKFIGWQGGTFYAAGYVIQGHGLSTYYIGNLLTVTSVEATAEVRLGEIWLEQSLFDDVLKIKAGQILADENFVISETAGLFVNSTFGFPGSFGTDLPDGGPAYPMAVPGVQVSFQPNDAWLLQAAIFNGNPNGPGANTNGMTFPIGDGAFFIAEAAYTYMPEGGSEFQSSTYKVGGWYNSEKFDSLGTSANGLPLGTGPAAADPLQYTGDYALYAVIDQALWQEPGTDDQGLRGFARFTISPQQNRNLIDWYMDVGLAYTGLLPGRDADVFGVGFAYANISPTLAGNVRLNNLLNGTFEPVPDYEAVLEVTYQAAVAPWLSVQPFFQYVFHPGGNAVNPHSIVGAAIEDAAVVGTRIEMTF